MNNQFDFNRASAYAQVVTDPSASTASQSSSSLATSLKTYLFNSYDLDLTKLRCAKSGRVTYVISDQELETLFQLADNNLAKFAERVELLVSQSHTAASWVLEDDQSLDRLRASQPVEFFNFAIRSLVELSSYYLQFRYKRDNALTSAGRFQVNSEFYRFAEQSFSYWEQASAEQLAQLDSLNDKLILMLCIGATSQAEKILDSELSFDWVARELANGTLLPRLNKLLNNIINAYRLRHNLALDARLSVNDIERLARETRIANQQQREAEREQRAKLAASSANYFRKLKQKKSPNYYLDNLIGELMVANNDKADYITQLTMKKAQWLLADKSLAKLDKLAKQALQPKSCQPIKTLNLNLKLTIKKDEVNA